jgi:outer membrane protein OmpA-like peptidoglycan-associated protein
MFLVEGHTARVGSLEGEKELSYERAMTIIKELVKRGIKEDRFICKARGGSSPIDTNETEEGRARNRRVEITILE